MKTYLSPLESLTILSIYGISLFFFGFVCFTSVKYLIGLDLQEKLIVNHQKNISPTPRATAVAYSDSASAFLYLRPENLLITSK